MVGTCGVRLLFQDRRLRLANHSTDVLVTAKSTSPRKDSLVRSMKDIVVVAPINFMTDGARRDISENRYGNVELLEGDQRTDVEWAQMAIDGGAKVLVSRGGTYERLRSKFDLPIVETKVTAFDLIEAFKEVKRLDDSGLVGVVGYHNVIDGAEIIAGVMNLKVVCYRVEDKRDVSAELERQIRLGVKVFLGDGNVVRAARDYDCKAVLVHSGSQAMQHAIEQARNILDATRQEKEKAQQFSTIIDFVHDGIIAIDSNGYVTLFNTASEKITGLGKQEALGRNIADIIPGARLTEVLETARTEIGDIQRLDAQTVIASNRIPIVVDGEVRGAVATYQDITEVQKLEQAIRIRLSEKGFTARYRLSDIIHASGSMSRCIEAARKIARYDTSVLICGPSGVGKELFAQGIHNSSHRSNSPFVAINCAALPETLIESELFGYSEGSFTGATKKGKAGLFEMAHGGTIFLDEISELPLLLQGRLLRVLQEKQVMRLGDSKLIPVDVRIVCATNKDLRDLIDSNQFRRDLYFRIAVFNLYIPPLSERVEDVELLATHFVEEFGHRYRKGRMKLTGQAVKYLQAYEYSGNVRELQGMIERAVIISEGSTVDVEDLTAMTWPKAQAPSDRSDAAFPDGCTLAEVENWYISHVLANANGSMAKCCSILGIDRTTLWRRVREGRLPAGPRPMPPAK